MAGVRRAQVLVQVVVFAPVIARVFIPVFAAPRGFIPFLPGFVLVGRHQRQAAADQDRRFGTLGKIRGENSDKPGTEGKTIENCLVDIAGIHHGYDVFDVEVEAVIFRVGGFVRFAVAARVVGNAAEVFAEVGNLRLVSARVNKGPGRDKHDGMFTLAINFIVQADSVAVDSTLGMG